MNYAQPNAVTMIQDLPELADIEKTQQSQEYIQNLQPSHYQQIGSMLPEGLEQKYQKAIRPNHTIHPQAGMAPMNRSEMINNEQEHSVQITQRFNSDPLHDISCLHIAAHIYECPICSRFYNNDKTVYIICIVILAFICLLLLKRVLNV